MSNKTDNMSTSSSVYRKPKLTMGERFKDARIVYNKHGKQTTDDVSDATGISKSTLSNIENDRRDPGARVICKLADHYGVSTDYLLGLTEIKSPETTAQAVISYTGLSEDNVKKLHDMAYNLGGPVVTSNDANTICLNGNKPFLDCLNDLLKSVYADRQTIMKHYIRLRRKTYKNDAIDFWYTTGEYASSIPGLEPSAYSDPRKQITFDNELVEYDCMKIAKAIEEGLIQKYVATQDEVDQVKKDFEEYKE